MSKKSNKSTNKGVVRQAFYTEVVSTLQDYFGELSIPYMPINGFYFFSQNQSNDFIPESLFESVDVVILQKDFAKAVAFFRGLGTTTKIAELPSKYVFALSIDGVGVIRVELIIQVIFPLNGTLSAEELFSKSNEKGSPLTSYPSSENALLLLVNKAFHFADQLIDKEIILNSFTLLDSPNFNKKQFEKLIIKFLLGQFFIYLNNILYKKQKVTLVNIKIGLYPKILTLCRMYKIYSIVPRILRKFIYKALLTDKPFRYLFNHLVNGMKNRTVEKLNHLYNKMINIIARKYIIENENTVFNTIMASSNRRLGEYSLNFAIDEEFIIGTSSGLWYLKCDTLYQLTFASSYGVTYDGKRWYANQNLGQFSRIISFEIDCEGERPIIYNPQYLWLGLPKSIHQIDYYDGTIYVVDTLNNRIITIDKQGKKQFYSHKTESKRPSVNNHFNSLFLTDSFIYLCAHNGTLKPKRYSEIYVLCKETMKLCNIITTTAGNAHNILLKNECLFYCDSLAGTLMQDKNDLFKAEDTFLRGLAYSEKSIVLGGSGFARRDARTSTDGALFVLTPDFILKYSDTLNHIGQIYEIRCVNGDYGLSEYSKKNARLMSAVSV